AVGAPTPAHPTAVVAAAAPARSTPAPAWPAEDEPGPLSIEAGLSRLDSLDGGPGAALVPLVRLRAALSPVLGARLTLAGLGTRPRVDSALGTATVRQDLALVE